MRLILFLLTVLLTSQLYAADGKLIATPGISQIEGTGGGGFVPWAHLDIKQRVLGVKARLYGDIVYSRFPQISLGIQHKKLDDPTVAFLLGADDDSGTDIYLSASKLHLGAIAGYNWLWNVTARSTEANQTGLLGFGNAAHGNRL